MRHLILGVMTLLLAAGGTLVAPSSGEAQDRPDRSQMSRQEARTEIHRAFERRVARELGLTPEEMSALQEVLHEYRRARREIFPQRARLTRESRELLESADAGGGPEVDERARTILDGLRALREREAEVLRSEEERLVELLGPSRALHLQLLREQLVNRIRGLQLRERDEDDGERDGRTLRRGRPSR